MTITGKQALITGSSRGIGRGIALKLAGRRRGRVHYYQNHEAAAETLAASASSDPTASSSRPMSRASRPAADVRRVRATFGTLDIFVSNARSELATFFESRSTSRSTSGPWRSTPRRARS